MKQKPIELIQPTEPIPTMDAIFIKGVLYVRESDCRAHALAMMRNGRSFDVLNSGLIEAAPLMLAALEALTDPAGHIYRGAGNECTGECRDVQAAIRKARGVNESAATERGFQVKPDERSVDGRMLSALALEKFKAYFHKNYPGLTIISSPDWHAPKIFNAVLSALEQAAKEQQ